MLDSKTLKGSEKRSDEGSRNIGHVSWTVILSYSCTFVSGAGAYQVKNGYAEGMKCNRVVGVMFGRLVLGVLEWKEYTLGALKVGLASPYTNWSGANAALLMRQW